MRRMILLAAVVALAALMLAAAPAFAANKDNDRKLDRQDVRLDKQILNNNDDGFNDNNFCDWECDNHDFFDNHDFDRFDDNVVFVNENDLADELCSPLNPDWVNNQVPGCIFGNNNANFGFVGAPLSFGNDCEWEFEEGWFWVDGHWQWGAWVLDC